MYILIISPELVQKLNINHTPIFIEQEIMGADQILKLLALLPTEDTDEYRQ